MKEKMVDGIVVRQIPDYQTPQKLESYLMPKMMKWIEFDAGHRIVGHEGQCSNLHGHRYRAEIWVQGSLDSIGRVIDFGVVKELVGGWIKDNWDHNMLLNSQDQLIQAVRKLNELEPIQHEVVGWGEVIFHGKDPYIFKNCNPTAEVIAEELFNAAINLLPSHIELTRTRIWETPSCCAQYSAYEWRKKHATKKCPAR